MNKEDKPDNRKLRKITGGNKANLKRQSGKVTEKLKGTALNIPSELAEQYLDIASVIILAIDANHKISSINKKGCRVLGYDARDIVGKDWFNNFIPGRVREEVKSVFNQLMSSQIEPVEYFENTIINSDGKERLIAWYNTVRRDESGNIIGTLSSGEDITERKQIEEALKTSEQKLRTLMDFSPVGISWADLKTENITYLNHKFTEVFGYTYEDIPSIRKWFDLAFPDIEYQKEVRSRRSSFESTHAKGNNNPPRETAIRCKDGSIKHAMVATNIIGDQVLAVFNDVTERKLAEEALKESEDKYRNLVENINEGIWVIDKDANTTYVNSAMALMFGYTTTEMIGRHLLSFMIEEQQIIAPGYLQRRSIGIREQHEFRFNKKDGSTIDTILSTIPLYDDHDQYSGAVAAVTDITNRKQAEDRIEKIAQEWRATFDSIADFISIHDRDFNIVRINRAFIDLLKMKPQEIVGKKCYELFHGTMLPISECPHQIAINTKHVHSCERFEPNLNMYLEITCAPIHDKTGEITGVVHVAKNITDRKRMELAAIQHEKLEALGGLAGGIAHDFNNILTALLGNISLAKLTVKSEEKTTERLIEAEKATMRAKELTQQLLTFAKGGTPIKKTASIIDIVQDTTKFVLHGSNIVPDFSIPVTIWNANVDIGQISQVVHNLVLNAKEAMPNGGVLKLKAENIVLDKDNSLPLPEGNYIKIIVEDKGIGIPESNLRKIFDPYFTTKQTGSGLGLATSYSIIKNHQGFMSVDSGLGVGTTFTIYLPATIKEIVPVVSEDPKPEVSKLKILVMDDEESILDIATSMLKYLGHEDIELARNGNEAVDLYKKAKDSNKPFDMVILDLTIPGNMGGKEVIKKLLEIDPAVKAIVSSGYSSDPIMSNYQHYGFYAVVPKPYTIEDMERVLGKVIQS